jgi:hypothetical protein
MPDKTIEIASGDYFRQIMLPDTGTFNVVLYAYLNDCFIQVTKQLKVVPDEDATSLKKSGKEDLIQGFTIYPNPSHGVFSAEVKLREKADAMLRLVGLADGVTRHIKQLKGLDDYTSAFDLSGLPAGAYVLYLQAGNESRTLTVVIE